jgi:hypothetical protein
MHGWGEGSLYMTTRSVEKLIKDCLFFGACMWGDLRLEIQAL